MPNAWESYPLAVNCGLTGEMLFWALKRRGHLDVSYVPRREDLVTEVRPVLRAGDMVLVLGAGDIYTVATDLVRSLAGTESTWTVQ